jgi:hypothetical protein
MLKTRRLKADADRSVHVSPYAFTDGTPDTAVYGEGTRITTAELTLEFWVDGRRHLLRLTDAQASQVARTAARAFDDFPPDHPDVADIGASRARQIARNATYRIRAAYPPIHLPKFGPNQ